MFTFLKNWRRRRILQRYRIPADLWRQVIADEVCIRHVSPADHERLREEASLFLHEKSIEPAHGFEITPAMKARIACRAVLPVLNLGLDYFRDWYAVIVYPDVFVSRDLYQDEAGVIHSQPEARAGEAWGRGPVIVSWEDVLSDTPGYNVIIHEMAHKLDLLDGVANGFPPLHGGMSQEQWTTAFTRAYEALNDQLEAGRNPVIDDYAASSPAEFFAVTSEMFFETPRNLQAGYPEIYEQLALFYRQRP